MVTIAGTSGIKNIRNNSTLALIDDSIKITFLMARKLRKNPI